MSDVIFVYLPYHFKMIFPILYNPARTLREVKYLIIEYIKITMGVSGPPTINFNLTYQESRVYGNYALMDLHLTDAFLDMPMKKLEEANLLLPNLRSEILSIEIFDTDLLYALEQTLLSYPVIYPSFEMLNTGLLPYGFRPVILRIKDSKNEDDEFEITILVGQTATIYDVKERLRNTYEYEDRTIDISQGRFKDEDTYKVYSRDKILTLDVALG